MSSAKAILILLFLIALSHSCTRNTCEGTKPAVVDNNNPPYLNLPKEEAVARYVVDLFEDSKDRLWMGTMTKGAICLDNGRLKYLNQNIGLPNNTVSCITEDNQGFIWLGTHGGLCRYDGSTLLQFGQNEGLNNVRISTLLIDRNNTLWVGTWGGIFKYKNGLFVRFSIPNPPLFFEPYQQTMDWVTTLKEDQQGNIWIARDGYGLCKFDGETFTYYTKSEGLPSNNVQSVEEGNNGEMWIGCRVTQRDHPDPNQRKGPGGLCLLKEESIQTFDALKGLHDNDVYTIKKDKDNKIWVAATGLGLYCFEGSDAKLIEGTDRMDLTYSMGIQAICRDHKNLLWIGMSGGLFRLIDSSVVHMGINTKWP